MVGMSLSSPLDSTTGAKSRHQKKKDSILISSRGSASTTSDNTQQQQAPEPTGMDSKRTVRKKVIIGGAAGASASASAAAVAAAPVAAAAAGTESVKGGALFRGSAAGTGMASERLRKAGASLAPVLGHGTGQSKTAAKLSPGGSSGGGNQVGDAAMEPLTPNLVSPSTGRSGFDSDNDDDQPPSAGVRHHHQHQHQQPRRFAPRNGAAAGAAGSSPAGVLRGARMDDGSGLAPEYQEQVRRNPLLWADMEFAAANGSHSDAVFTHYCSHLRSSFVGKEPRAQHMDLAALARLANDTVERFLQRHRRHIASTNPKFGKSKSKQLCWRNYLTRALELVCR